MDKDKDKEKIQIFIDKNKVRFVDDYAFDFNKRREQTYNDILTLYKSSTDKTLFDKRIYKWITFIVSILILIGTAAATFWYLLFHNNESGVEGLSVVLPLLTSFLTVFIVIPQIITNYLFDKDEEKHLVDIIQILKGNNPKDDKDK